MTRVTRPPLPGSSVAEQVTVNHLVAGSIPARAAIFGSSLKRIPCINNIAGLPNSREDFSQKNGSDANARTAENPFLRARPCSGRKVAGAGG